MHYSLCSFMYCRALKSRHNLHFTNLNYTTGVTPVPLWIRLSQWVARARSQEEEDIWTFCACHPAIGYNSIPIEENSIHSCFRPQPLSVGVGLRILEISPSLNFLWKWLRKDSDNLPLGEMTQELLIFFFWEKCTGITQNYTILRNWLRN